MLSIPSRFVFNCHNSVIFVRVNSTATRRTPFINEGKLMKKTLLATAVAALAFQASAGTVTHDGADLVIKTGGGFSVATTDGQFSFAPTGRFHLDYNNYDGV